VQHRELLVHVGDARLGLADEPERAAERGNTMAAMMGPTTDFIRPSQKYDV
jgi:hypothetical protein